MTDKIKELCLGHLEQQISRCPTCKIDNYNHVCSRYVPAFLEDYDIKIKPKVIEYKNFGVSCEDDFFNRFKIVGREDENKLDGSEYD